MRSPFAYTPRPGPLQAASPGAAVAYLGSLVVVSFLHSGEPLVLIAAAAAAATAGILAGARRAVAMALWMSLVLAAQIAAVNALVVNRGETVLARLGDWPILGQVDVTLEALVAGLAIGLLVVVSILAVSVYSACVDPDRVLRALRPLTHRSALTATLISRLLPVAAADAARLRDAAALRGPGAAEVGLAPLLRRLLAGSLDRAVDVAATLELRGYGLEAPPRRRLAPAPRSQRRPGRGSRYDRRFYAIGAALVVAGIAAELLGAGGLHTYPTIRWEAGPASVALAVLVALSGLAPLRRRPRRETAAARLRMARV